MSDTKIDIDSEKRLVIRYVLDMCENCCMLMLPTYGDARYLPNNLKNKVKAFGIREEHYRKWNVCNECIRVGNYTNQCDICSIETPFANLIFELEFYPKYPDDESHYVYVCKQCHSMRAQQVIDVLLKADKVKDLRKGI